MPLLAHTHKRSAGMCRRQRGGPATPPSPAALPCLSHVGGRERVGGAHGQQEEDVMLAQLVPLSAHLGPHVAQVEGDLGCVRGQAGWGAEAEGEPRVDGRAQRG